MKHLAFKKHFPGAVCSFQPDDIDDYKGEAWDIRVSIGFAPLDEAFYITIEDPNETQLSVRQLLDKYVLDSAKALELNVKDDPDLPFLQQELIELFKSEKNKQLQIDVYVNNSDIGPIDIDQTAEKLMGTTVQGVYGLDYRNLDLVLVPKVVDKALDEVEKDEYNYRRLFLLCMFCYYYKQGNDRFGTILLQLGKAKLTKTCSTIVKEFVDEKLLTKKQLKITNDGISKIESLITEIEKLIQLEKYSSVSVYPPALGIPNGFDIRTQIVEYLGFDVERSAMLMVLYQEQNDLFATSDWQKNWQECAGIELFFNAMAYKTNFSSDILDLILKL